MANKDGGAHVDQELEPTYEQVLQGAEISIQHKYITGAKSEQIPFEHLHFATIRQIGYEVLNSPAFINRAKESPPE